MEETGVEEVVEEGCLVWVRGFWEEVLWEKEV